MIREKPILVGQTVQVTHKTAYPLPEGLIQGDDVVVVELSSTNHLATVEKDGKRYELLWFLCWAGDEEFNYKELRWKERPFRRLPPFKWVRKTIGDG